MKKYIILGFSLLFFTFGCDSMMNTPTKRVEEFLNKYQRQDSEVLSQLKDVVDESSYDFNDDEMNSYMEVMKRQYKDLTYTIKEEMIDGDDATVTVEIEVYDYKNAMNEAEDYYISNPGEFKNEEDVIDNHKYIDYRIQKLKEVKDRIKYTLNLTLSKKSKEWIMNNITETDREKIHGLYSN